MVLDGAIVVQNYDATQKELKDYVVLELISTGLSTDATRKELKGRIVVEYPD